MPQSFADRSDSLALAAAMSRHPAAGARATVSPLPGAAPAGAAASFATVAALLTGPWRVNDPVAFAAAMRAAPPLRRAGGDRRPPARLALGRAALPLRRAGGDRRPPARLALGALRERLAGPARAAEGLAGATGAEPAGAVVLPFRR